MTRTPTEFEAVQQHREHGWTDFDFPVQHPPESANCKPATWRMVAGAIHPDCRCRIYITVVILLADSVDRYRDLQQHVDASEIAGLRCTIDDAAAKFFISTETVDQWLDAE